MLCACLSPRHPRYATTFQFQSDDVSVCYSHTFSLSPPSTFAFSSFHKPLHSPLPLHCKTCSVSISRHPLLSLHILPGSPSPKTACGTGLPVLSPSFVWASRPGDLCLSEVHRVQGKVCVCVCVCEGGGVWMWRRDCVITKSSCTEVCEAD